MHAVSPQGVNPKMEKKIYNQLRAHKRAKRSSNRVDSRTDDREDHFDRYHEETMEQLTDFSIEEIKQLLIDDNIALEFFGIIGQGKEANVYWIQDSQYEPAAAKLFRIHTTSHNFNSLHARSNLSDTAKLSIASGLCLREWENLRVLYDEGIRVPKPKSRHEFAYLMEFLGDEFGPSPLLRQVKLDRLSGGKNFVIEVLDEILDQLDLMFNRAEMVHGDFSEHNIVWYEDRPWIIDFLQSQRWHPKFDTAERVRKRDVLKVLKKDIEAILEYFQKTYRISYDPVVVFNEIAGDIDDWSADELMSEYVDPDALQQEIKRLNL
jgi:RIO kinase 1